MLFDFRTTFSLEISAGLLEFVVLRPVMINTVLMYISTIMLKYFPHCVNLHIRKQFNLSV